MAPTPATMTVNFTSNYTGPHRVCWRIGPSGAYDCTTIVNCPGGGNPCQAIIPITVDNNSCAPVNFNGYVQAACELEASLNGRVPFSVDFIPNPDCKKYDLTCTTVGITAFDVTDPGSGYAVGSNPAISVVGGGGSGTSAYGVVGDGGIKTWNLTNLGSGYLGGGSGLVTGVPAQNISGSGVGATFDVLITAGSLTSISFPAFPPTAPGTGYAPGDTFEFNNAFLGGTGSGIIVTINSINTGEIQYVIVVNPGSGYSTPPSSSTIAPPAIGTQALVTAVMERCVDFNPGLDCNGDDPGLITNRPLGFVYKMCSPLPPPVPSGWTVAENGCCYDCLTVSMQNNSDLSVNVRYMRCEGGVPIASVITLPPMISTIIPCVVNNSWIFPSGASIVVTTLSGGVCP